MRLTSSLEALTVCRWNRQVGDPRRAMMTCWRSCQLNFDKKIDGRNFLVVVARFPFHLGDFFGGNQNLPEFLRQALSGNRLLQCRLAFCSAPISMYRVPIFAIDQPKNELTPNSTVCLPRI